MWIARDKNGSLYAYAVKPERFDDFFAAVIGDSWTENLGLDTKEFPEVT